jgi:hypothetical protein
MNDGQLLESYVAEASEKAFTELARRHMGLVYSAAWRHVGDQELAKDITKWCFPIWLTKPVSSRSDQSWRDGCIGTHAIPRWILCAPRDGVTGAKNNSWK